MLQDPASQAAWNDAIQASALVCLQEHVHVSVTSNICYGSCQQTAPVCTGNSNSGRGRGRKPAQWHHFRTERGQLHHVFVPTGCTGTPWSNVVLLACSSILRKVMRHNAKNYLIHFRSGPARKSSATVQPVIAASYAITYAGLASALQVLWSPQSCLCCKVSYNWQVVLQWAYHWNSLMHHHSPGTFLSLAPCSVFIAKGCIRAVWSHYMIRPASLGSQIAFVTCKWCLLSACIIHTRQLQPANPASKYILACTCQIGHVSRALPAKAT